MRPQTRRSWTVELIPSGDEIPAEFTFPPARRESFAAKFERYEDADIVKTGGVVLLRESPAGPKRWLWPGLGAAAFVLFLVVGIVFLRRRRRNKPPRENRYQRPQTVTPFSLLSLLERIRGDESINLPAVERQELGVVIHRLEDNFFRNGDPETSSIDLGALLDEWLTRIDGRSASLVEMN